MRLAAIDSSNWREAARVTVDDDQLAFVAAWQPIALVILAKSYVGAEDKVWDPLVIHDHDGGVVGVAALAHAGRGGVELFHLAVDRSQQRRGLGGRAVELIVDRAVSHGFSHLELTVHPANVVAQRLYRRAGFAPTGAQRHGEAVWSRSWSARGPGAASDAGRRSEGPGRPHSA